MSSRKRNQYDLEKGASGVFDEDDADFPSSLSSGEERISAMPGEFRPTMMKDAGDFSVDDESIDESSNSERYSYIERDERQASVNFGPIGANSMVRNPLYANRLRDHTLDVIQEEDGEFDSTNRGTILFSQKGERLSNKEKKYEMSPSSIFSKDRSKQSMNLTDSEGKRLTLDQRPVEMDIYKEDDLEKQSSKSK